jgi:5'-nucleotidase
MVARGKKETTRALGPAVLLTNDDGVQATGIWHLYDALVPWARVTVVAPGSEQSGVGHAFTINKPLHVEKTQLRGAKDGYVVSGTPVDCVKIAISVIMPKRPEIVVAGLNIGENSGLSAFYSGTVAAAREGAFWDIPSVAFSICEEGKQHVSAYADLAAGILKQLYAIEKRKKKHPVYYNVNFPACAPDKCKGVRVTQQSMAFFDDRYETIDIETHHTKKGFVIYGEKKDIEPSNAYDSRALMNHYITITPLCFNATAPGKVPGLAGMERRIRGKG